MKIKKTYRGISRELMSLKKEFKINPTDDLYFKIYLLDKELKDIDKSIVTNSAPNNHY